MLRAKSTANNGSTMGSATPGAVVMGSDYRGLTVVRSLGRRKIPTCVLIDNQFQTVAVVSRYTLHTRPWPANESERQQVDFLLDLAARDGFKDWTLFPTTDEHAALLARHHQELSASFRVTTSPWEVVRQAYDKRLSYQLADSVGVARPQTWHPVDVERLESIELDFPVILKPAYKDTQNRFTWEKAWKVSQRDELLRRFREASVLVDPQTILVQELIPGDGKCQFSFGALCLDGQPLGSVVAQRRRQYPVDFGRSSSYVETIDHPAVEAAARLLLASLHYTGLIEIEFKCDPRNGILKVLDLNPRIWWWNSLSWQAGVDFPQLFWLLSRGEHLPPIRAIQGVRWVKMVTDFPAAFGEIRRGRLRFAEYFRSLKGPLEFAVHANDDLLPSIFDLPLLAVSKWRQRSNFKGAANSLRGLSQELTPCRGTNEKSTLET